MQILAVLKNSNIITAFMRQSRNSQHLLIWLKFLILKVVFRELTLTEALLYPHKEDILAVVCKVGPANRMRPEKIFSLVPGLLSDTVDNKALY
jgi:hypothetical protein